MKPKSPFTQPYEKLPKELPIYPLENALLPGGELPLTIDEPNYLAMFLDVLKTDQLIGMVQPQENNPDSDIYHIGCAGRIRQYRERKDGKLNIMLTGICRYKIIEELPMKNGYRRVMADWSDFKQDYETEEVAIQKIDFFKASLRNYFDRHTMQVDWKVLDELPIEQVVNNLVLILNLSVPGKQRLLEAPTVADRLELFSQLLEEIPAPIAGVKHEGSRVN
ncbi:MAG: LON peptidase substrate-binding domain-containing protein [Gammaproteobacteria bacterium]|nr:LON peptidase substrate-binding domain-containing protein [Gammaproteobacteria bacterium]MDX2486640.1 LON peptidase substrate-binding domain-containing protein [Gammaproteobacteria bacterium]